MQKKHNKSQTLTNYLSEKKFDKNINTAYISADKYNTQTSEYKYTSDAIDNKILMPKKSKSPSIINQKSQRSFKFRPAYKKPIEPKGVRINSKELQNYSDFPVDIFNTSKKSYINKSYANTPDLTMTTNTPRMTNATNTPHMTKANNSPTLRTANPSNYQSRKSFVKQESSDFFKKCKTPRSNEKKLL